MKSEAEHQLLRAKILGTMIREARFCSGKTIAACAQFLDLSTEEFEDFELGKKSPSLPQLELIAHQLNIPVDRFWTSEVDKIEIELESFENIAQIIRVRDRIIGAIVKQARLAAGLSAEQLGEQTFLDPAEIEAIELGRIQVSVPQLESISKVLGLSIQDFCDQAGLIGRQNQQHLIMREFMNLPEDLQQFVTRPENRPYLELAIRLSGMPAAKLRAIAEGILEITY